MHAVVAHKISHDPTLLKVAFRNLARWKARWKGGEAPAWFREWEALLKQPWQQVAARITEPNERGARLRQSSPFAGVLTSDERRRIHEAFRA
jgi:hypothetical protein